MRASIRIAVAASAILLTACATRYKPESIWNDGGFSDARLGPGEHQVWFAGNVRTSAEKAADLAMLRAADLCLGEGKTFMLASQFRSESAFAANGVGRILGSTRPMDYYQPHIQTGPTRVYTTPGKALYTTRSGLRVACLAEPVDGALDASELAATMRKRYRIPAPTAPSA